MYLAERPFALWHRLSAGRKTVSQTINGGYFVSLNEKRIKPGAAKPITGIKRQPARNQIGKQADQALSTAREPISMPEGGAAEAKLFEKVTARKEPQQRRKSTGAKTAGGAARSAAKTAAKKEDPKTAGRKKEKAAPEKKGASKTAAETKKAGRTTTRTAKRGQKSPLSLRLR